MNTKKQLVWLFIVGVSRLYAQNPSCNFSVFEIHNNVTCPGHSDGSIDLTVTSDQDSTFSFIWSSDSSIGLNAQSEDQAGLLAGFYFVTVSDTSNCEVPLTIEILDGNDIIPPTIYCPSNIYFELPPGACDKVIDFDITAFDNCGAPVLTQTDTTGLSAGNAFPIGITTLIFLASDSFNVSTCSFNIEIVEYLSLIHI